MDNCWPLLNQKQHGMFPLRRFVDLVRIYLLLIVSRNHSNRVKYCSDLAACCPLHNLYFNGLQIKSWQNFKDKGHLFTSNLPWLLLKFAEYLFLKHFFISLKKSVLLHDSCLISKFPEIFMLLCRKIFCFLSHFSRNFFQ